MGLVMRTVFIGYDGREHDAYRVAELSLRRNSPFPINVVPLEYGRLAAYGLLRRPQDRRGHTYDIISNAPQSTDFAISRFLVPHLHQAGWALFVDADVVFMESVLWLFSQADDSKALMVVDHGMVSGSMGTKMDGQQQQVYARKNQSSVCLWNCDHHANRRLSLQDVNERPGRDLHRFYWLAESEIGYLTPECNWLVGIQPKPANPVVAHFTLGGPFLRGWQGAEHDEIWQHWANQLSE
jgi:hypothetical protein